MHMDEKICKKCGRLLPLSMFHKNKKNKDGHISSCKDCMKKYTKNYNQKHRDDINIKRQEYYQNHREHELSRVKEYREKHKEETQQYKEQYRKKNRNKIRALQREYWKQYYTKNKDILLLKNKQNLYKRRSVEGTITQEQFNECLNFFDNVCAYSGEEFGNDAVDALTMDHVIPLNNGGTNYIWNIIPAKRTFNSSKGTKEMLSWYQEQDYYSDERLQKILEWQEYAYNKWSNDSIAS